MSKATKLNSVQISLQISVKCYPNHFPGNLRQSKTPLLECDVLVNLPTIQEYGWLQLMGNNCSAQIQQMH